MVPGDDPGFVVETVKAADDGRGIIVRGYEALGGRRRVRLVTRCAPARRPSAPTCSSVTANRCRRSTPTVRSTLTVRPFELVTLRLLP